jgi:hypothetical protein
LKKCADQILFSSFVSRYRLKKKQLEMQQEQTLAELLAQNKALRKQHKKILAKFNGARWMAKSML